MKMKSRKKTEVHAITFGHGEEGNKALSSEVRDSCSERKNRKRHKNSSTSVGKREDRDDLPPADVMAVLSENVGIKCDPEATEKQTNPRKKKQKKHKCSRGGTESTEESFRNDESLSTSHQPVEQGIISQYNVAGEMPSECFFKVEKGLPRIKEEILDDEESCRTDMSGDGAHTNFLPVKVENSVVRKSRGRKRRIREGNDELVSDGEITPYQMSEQVSGTLQEDTLNTDLSGQGNHGNPEPVGMNQEAVVKKTDLFVSPEVDAIIHSENIVNGDGRVEKLLRAELRGQGIHLRTGRWTVKENEKLNSNWEEIIRNHPISNPYSLLTGESSGDKDQKTLLKKYIQKTSFYKALARGLNRSTYSCYMRARRMFHMLDKGSYTEEDFRTLNRLRQTHGNKWTKIGKLMNRTGSSLCDMYRRRADMTQTGQWSAEEEIQLLDAVRQVMGSTDVTHLYRQIPWQQVAGHVTTRSAPQCREHWWKKMAWTVNNEGYRHQWKSSDRKRLIEKIYVMPAFDESEIDWDALHLMFEKSVSPQYLQKRWFYLKTCVPDFQRKSFEEICEYLYNKYDDDKNADEDNI